MRTLFSKILLAQVVTVILALAVVTVITRISLHRGLKEFLETQETAVLGTEKRPRWLGPGFAPHARADRGATTAGWQVKQRPAPRQRPAAG